MEAWNEESLTMGRVAKGTCTYRLEYGSSEPLGPGNLGQVPSTTLNSPCDTKHPTVTHVDKCYHSRGFTSGKRQYPQNHEDRP
jgi:hypothetical protein